MGNSGKVKILTVYSARAGGTDVIRASLRPFEDAFSGQRIVAMACGDRDG